MPSFSYSGGGTGAGAAFNPAASDAFQALLARMPAYAEQSFTLKSRAAQQAEQARAQAIEDAKRKARYEEEDRRIAAKELAAAPGRAAAERARQQMESRGALQALTRQRQNYLNIGQLPSSDAAGEGAAADFAKMRLGIPGAY